jgi:hypothetical protein
MVSCAVMLWSRRRMGESRLHLTKVYFASKMSSAISIIIMAIRKEELNKRH